MRGEIAQHIEALQLFRHLLPREVHISQAIYRFRRLLLIIEVDHRVEAVAIIIALHDPVAPGFPCHPEWRVVELFVRVRAFPGGQRLACLVFQLLPGRKFDVFGGIHPETVNAIVPDPLAEPVGQVIARGIARNGFRMGIGFVLIEIG